MISDFIMGALPTTVSIGGTLYPIRWDYRIWMEFDSIRKENRSNEEKIIKLLQRCYPKIPEDINGAIDKMLWFYRCGENEEKEEKKQRYQRRTSSDPAFSFDQDTPYIYAAFKEQYGIDLTEAQELHWWKFMALFESLNEETKISKIMYYRKVSTSGMPKDKRAFINDMKRIYRIKDESFKRMTLQERNQSWVNYVRSRHVGK